MYSSSHEWPQRRRRRHRATYLAPSAGVDHPHFYRDHRMDDDDDDDENENDHIIPLLVEIPTPNESHNTTSTGSPLMVQSPVSPPSSGELSPSLTALDYQLLQNDCFALGDENQLQQQQYFEKQDRYNAYSQHNNLRLPNVSRYMKRRRIQRWLKKSIKTAYNGSIDAVLLILVCFMGCFFYDVEVKVVKGGGGGNHGGGNGNDGHRVRRGRLRNGGGRRVLFLRTDQNDKNDEAQQCRQTHIATSHGFHSWFRGAKSGEDQATDTATTTAALDLESGTQNYSHHHHQYPHLTPHQTSLLYTPPRSDTSHLSRGTWSLSSPPEYQWAQDRWDANIV